jgi:hypothetical protein
MESSQVVRSQGDGGVQDLRVISTAMKEYINTENEAVMQTVVDRINRNPGLIRRLFPNAFEKEEQRITLDRMRTFYDKKKQFFELYAAMQLEMARMQGDALVASVGIDLQGKLAAFATQKIDELSQTIGESRQKFLVRIKPQLEDLDNYKNMPDLHDPARQSIQNEVKTYFAGIDELLNGFIKALKSKVS